MARTNGILRRLDWRVGVDNEFGWLIAADQGRRRLCEVRRIVKNVEVVLIDLHNGEFVIAPHEDGFFWQSLTPEQACAAVGIDQPHYDGEAETKRRTDPYHVERHTSARWRAIVDVAYTQNLPCGFAVGDWLREDFDGRWELACFEAPEKFASHVCEQLARGSDMHAAISACIARDVQSDRAEDIQDILTSTGWLSAIRHLDALQAAGWVGVPDAARMPRPEPTADDVDEPPVDEQLTFL